MSKMSKRWTITVCAVLTSTAWATTGAEAQWTRGDEGWCESSWGGGDRDRYCFTREAELADPSALRVDAGLNGGVSVEGWSRDVVLVRARIWANARSTERARQIAEGVRVGMDGGRLSASGPDTGGRESWGVSWEVTVPTDTDLEVETHNGGIDVAGVTGRIRLEALNGGVELIGVGGDVVGRTTNGGVHVVLEGSGWSGDGLDVETTNGGVTVVVPEGYSARLETGTVNGGFDLQFPLTVQGRIGRRLSVDLGEGGRLIRAVTTNGGVEIRRGSRPVR